MPNNARKDAAAINLIQITDCHLTKKENGELLGVNTRESLNAVTDLVKHNIAINNHASPDYILATGDLAQDASAEAYCYFKSHMDQFGCPVKWFPGNHDDKAVMKSVIGEGKELEKCFEIGGWQIILLDSLVKNSVHGFLASEELDLLEASLKNNPQLHTLISFHHHPINIDCVWLDKIGLHNQDAFFDIIDRYDNVKALLWGHIHQELNGQRGDVALYATPSTCIQFLPKSEDFAVDSSAPGYRWMRLLPNGDIETKVVRAENYEFDLDLASNGY